MKNLIVNIFKTLFFFDAAVIIIHLLPELSADIPALEMLIGEAEIAAVPLLLTVVYFFVVERRRLGVMINRRLFRSAFCGFRYAFLPLCVVAGVLVLTKSLKFTGVDIPNGIWLWIAAVLCECIGTELLLRGYLFALYKKYYGFTASAVITTMLCCSLNREIFGMPKIAAANILIFNFILCFVSDKNGSVLSNIFLRFFYIAISRFLLSETLLFSEYPVLLKTEYSGKALLTGGSYGVENSAVTLAVATLVLIFLSNRKYRFTKRLREHIKYKKRILGSDNLKNDLFG